MPGRGGQIARSAGQQVILNNREAGYALVKIAFGRNPPRSTRTCYATIGQVGNIDHMNVSSRQGRSQPLAGHSPDTCAAWS